MTASQLTPLDRLLSTLGIVAKEARHLGRQIVAALASSLAEHPGSQIEVLNRAERLGVVEDVAAWLEARQLRNRLVHEYMTDNASFAADLKLAEAYSRMLSATYRRLRADTVARLGIPVEDLPAE